MEYYSLLKRNKIGSFVDTWVCGFPGGASGKESASSGDIGDMR